MNDLAIVQALIDAHRAAVERFDDGPQEVWEDLSAAAIALGDQLDRAGEALCFYRPTTLEGVHLKAEYMMSVDIFVGGENGDSDFTPAELISGFLPVDRAPSLNRNSPGARERGRES